MNEQARVHIAARRRSGYVAARGARAAAANAGDRLHERAFARGLCPGLNWLSSLLMTSSTCYSPVATGAKGDEGRPLSHEIARSAHDLHNGDRWLKIDGDSLFERQGNRSECTASESLCLEPLGRLWLSLLFPCCYKAAPARRPRPVVFDWPRLAWRQLCTAPNQKTPIDRPCQFHQRVVHVDDLIKP